MCQELTPKTPKTVQQIRLQGLGALGSHLCFLIVVDESERGIYRVEIYFSHYCRLPVGLALLRFRRHRDPRCAAVGAERAFQRGASCRPAGRDRAA